MINQKKDEIFKKKSSQINEESHKVLTKPNVSRMDQLKFSSPQSAQHFSKFLRTNNNLIIKYKGNASNGDILIENRKRKIFIILSKSDMTTFSKIFLSHNFNPKKIKYNLEMAKKILAVLNDKQKLSVNKKLIKYLNKQ